MILANAADERVRARRKLPRFLFDYIDGGSYDEVTLAGNVEALRRINLRQRVLRDVSTLDTSVEVFGQRLSLPAILGPVGFSGMFARRGEVQAARAAEAAGTRFTLSTVGICSLEEVRAGVQNAIWFQLYMIKDRGYMADLLARAAALGTEVLVFTVDLPVAGSRYRDLRSGFSARLPAVQQISRSLNVAAHPGWIWDVYLNGRPHDFGNIVAAIPEGQAGDFAGWIHRNFDPSVTWRDIAWVRERWPGRILIKGILDREDAQEAVRSGLDGLVVSNHGGRQLDGALPAITALPPIADAVGDALTVLMDGGVRSGLDVLKAMALGARAVLLGRAWAFALAADGERGVARMLARLKGELRVAMALTGTTSLEKVDASLVAQVERQAAQVAAKAAAPGVRRRLAEPPSP